MVRYSPTCCCSLRSLVLSRVITKKAKTSPPQTETLTDDGGLPLLSILAKLAIAGEAKAMPALLDRLDEAAPNQFPMYAELAAGAVTPAHKARLVAILQVRLKTIDAPAKKVRVEKVLRKLSKS